jgi:NAD(P)-dependent dehydrogenase (short-subunit alcohol dehydrogenase family)
MGLYTNLGVGIGAACAIALAEAGAAICLVLREPNDDIPPNLTTIDAISNLGGTAHSVHCDLNNLDSVKGVFQKALDAMGGRIDVLVNCAGIQRRSPSLDFSETDWDDVRSRHFCSVSVLCFSHYGTIASFSSVTPFPCTSFICLHCFYFTGFRRQSQGRLAPFAGCWPPHGSKASWKDYQLLFPPHFPRGYHCSRIRRCQRRLRAAHESLKQRMEPVQCPG